MVVSTVAIRYVSKGSHWSRDETGDVTWLFGIVGIKLGREASCYSHLDEEYDRV